MFARVTQKQFAYFNKELSCFQPRRRRKTCCAGLVCTATIGGGTGAVSRAVTRYQVHLVVFRELATRQFAAAAWLTTMGWALRRVGMTQIFASVCASSRKSSKKNSIVLERRQPPRPSGTPPKTGGEFFVYFFPITGKEVQFLKGV